MSDMILIKPMSDFEKELFQLGAFSSAGRTMFLLYLQRLYSDAFRRLNSLWRSEMPHAAGQWAAEFNVVDEWLLEAAQQTITRWNADPVGPAATLNPNYPWFFYLQETYPPDFAPTFRNPYPTYTMAEPMTFEQVSSLSIDEIKELSSRVSVEPLHDFEARMRKEFNKKVRSYVRFIESIWGYDSFPQMPMHAAWAVYAFRGFTIARIARDFDPRIMGIPLDTSSKKPDESFLESRHGVKDADAAVRKGIKRFCEATRLTLPRHAERRA